MTRAPISPEQLKAMGLTLLEFAKGQLKSSGGILPVIVLGDAMDGTHNFIIGLPPEAMNSGNAKEAIAQKAQAEIRKHGFCYAITLFDSFMLTGKDEAESKLILKLKESTGLGLEEIHKMGYGTLYESAIVCVQSMEQNGIWRMDYRREDDGTVSDISEPIFAADAKMGGRFTFFNSTDPVGQP